MKRRYPAVAGYFYEAKREDLVRGSSGVISISWGLESYR